MKKRLPLILVFLLLAAAIGAGVYYHFAAKTKFNDSYVNGNTAGNLYNGGLFCEYDGTIYFANPSDNDSLYSMDVNGGSLKKLCDDSVSYLNVDEHYIYYARNNRSSSGDFSFLIFNTNSLCRINRDGNEDSVLVLDPEPCMYASLSGNYIYYLHYTEEEGTVLYKVKIDGSGKEKVSDNSYFTCSALGQYIYYNGLETEHYIWRLNTANDSAGLLYGGNCWMPTVTNNETVAYFMDCDNQYAIARVELDTGEKTLLCDDRVDWYNVYGNYIYFQRSDTDNPALCRMHTDGSSYEELASGNYKNLNVTSSYFYFQDYYTGQTFRMATNGNGSMEVFNPGTGK